MTPENFVMKFFNKTGIFVKTIFKSNSLETVNMSYESCRTVFRLRSFLGNYHLQPFCNKLRLTSKQKSDKI